VAKSDNVNKYRDVESFKSRKNFEEREVRKASKYKQTIEEMLETEDEVEVEIDYDDYPNDLK